MFALPLPLFLAVLGHILLSGVFPLAELLASQPHVVSPDVFSELSLEVGAKENIPNRGHMPQRQILRALP